MHTHHVSQPNPTHYAGLSITPAQIDALPRFGARADGAVRVHDGDADLWRRRAGTALEKGDPALALRCWAIVSRLQPQALDALFQQGCCHALIDQPARAYLAFDAVAGATAAPPALRRRAAELALLVDPLAF